MCGIAGMMMFDGSPPELGVLERMVSMLSHRGPDATGSYCDAIVGLGHARLSIIDLSGGAQPMSNADGSLWITFNGEIFNFVELAQELKADGQRFATRSDTEVILHLYQRHGEDCVNYLNGQWAFAIWDPRRKRLFLSRDRIGVRPLFYTRTRSGFLFASEIKALFVDPAVERALDLQALQQVFTFWVPVSPRTAFEGISELPPGNSMVIERNQVRTSRYWRLDYEPDTDFSERTVQRKADEALTLLTDAARIRLRSDVPVGAYLSGGLDSTLVTALICRSENRLKTFSVSFADSEYDEGEYQRQASAFLNTEHAEVHCSYDDIAAVFPDVIWHTETPVLRTAPAPLYLLSQLVQQSGFKVVLTGEGSDELFGGYDIFRESKLRRFCARFSDSRIRPVLFKRLYPYMKNIQHQSPAYLQAWFGASSADLASPFFSHLPRWKLTSKLQTFFSGDVKARLAQTDPTLEIESALPPGYNNWHSLCQAQYLEAAYLLPGYILSSQGDRMAMAHSVEGRYPFLDYRVVEFASRLHPNLKVRVLNEKYLLKRAAGELVPRTIRNRPKQPYRAPDGRSFFKSAAGEYIRDALSPAQINANGIFDATAVARLVEKFSRGAAIGVKDDMALVGILSTQLVVRQFVENFRKSSPPAAIQFSTNCAA